MKARIKWVEGATFVAESGSGHALVIDGPPDHGGRNLGARPMETVLMGLGACSAFDVVSILAKTRQRVSSAHVELDAERADAVPAVFTRIHLHYVIRGRGVTPAAVARAVELSVDKYCSVTAMLRPHVAISHDWRIEEDADEAGNGDAGV
jgi:putative redox protein